MKTITIITVLALGCSSSHTNDKLFGEVGGTGGEVDAGGSGGVAGGAGAGSGGVAGAGAAGAPAGGGAAGLGTGGVAGAVVEVDAGEPDTGGADCACAAPSGTSCTKADFVPAASLGMLCNYPGESPSCCACETGATPPGSCYENVPAASGSHTFWCCH